MSTPAAPLEIGTIPVPFGWFRICDSAELAAGDVRRVDICERSLVAWRTEAGEARVADAWCPHLGAHLGVGGHVSDGAITCPFHGWRFDGTGTCLEIPYSEKVNRKARLRTYPVVVRNGFVLAWRHPDPEVAPMWEVETIDEIGDAGWSDYYSSEYVINTVPQEMMENSADPAHFLYVHGTETVAEVEEYNTDGPCSVMLSKQSYVTPRGTTWGRIDVYNYGPGFSQMSPAAHGYMRGLGKNSLFGWPTMPKVEALRTDEAAVERIARDELGMVRPGEILFQFPE